MQAIKVFFIFMQLSFLMDAKEATLQILILGGTKFVGRAIAQEARLRNHEVTLFNRGKTDPDLFKEIEKIQGDRFHDLHLLSDRIWDVVIDTSGYFPDNQAQIVKTLNGKVDQFIYISTISVYEDLTSLFLDEDSKVKELKKGMDLTKDGDTYGERKVYSEKEILQNFSGKKLIIRPGIIVGPFDPTGRFSYWVEKIFTEDKIIAPPEPNAPLQVIDVRDLAKWVIDMAEKKEEGIFNAAGPELSWNDFLHICQKSLGRQNQIVWSKKTEKGKNFPLYVTKENQGLFRVRSDKAIQKGLTFRPLEETIVDTNNWLISI